MKFTSVLTTFLATISAVYANPINTESQKRDVFTPPVLYPHAGTHWYTGQTHNVTWDTSDAPVNITDQFGGSIQLGANSLITPLILADNFNVRLGRIEVTVPWVVPGDQFFVVFFGDSGDWSQTFSINQ